MKKKTLPDIVWNAIDKDDFVCNIDKYCLRVEQMDKNYWWWAVYLDNDEIGFSDPKASTEMEAKLFAENCFLRYYYQN